MNKELVVVLGMHRSGTSVLTKGVAELGYYVGNTMKASTENAKGYFENGEIVSLNDTILEELCLDWQTCDITYLDRVKVFLPLLVEKYSDKAIEILEDLFLNSNKCVVKDPRVSVLMPFWEYVFNKLNIEYKYVLAIRNPDEVSKSFVARKDGTYEEGVKLWLYYNTSILNNLRNQVLVVDYNTLLSQTNLVMNKLCEWLNVDKNEYAENIKEFSTRFVEKQLNHQNGEKNLSNSLVDEMYSFLNTDYLNYTDIKKFLDLNEDVITKFYINDIISPEGQFAKVYIDNGNGFSEENAVVVELNSAHQQQINISLEQYGKIKNLRVDPMDAESIVIVKSIIFKNSEQKINISNTNAVYQNGQIYFLPKDGQIYLNDINSTLEEIEIKTSCLKMDKISSKLCMKITDERLIEKLNKEKIEILNEKDSYIFNIEKTKAFQQDLIQEKDTHIFNIENIIQEKDKHISYMENVIQEKDTHIFNVENIIKEKDTHISNIENIIKEKDKHILSIENVIKDKDKHIGNIDDILKNKDEYITSIETILKDQEKEIVRTETLLKDKEAALIDKEIIIANRGEIIDKVVNDLDRNIKHNQELVAINLGLTIGMSRRREKIKYILKYPLRLAKKTIGFFIHPRVTIEFYSDLNFVKKTGILDKNYYIGMSQDYKIHSFNYAEHFVRHGWLSGLKPNPNFNKDVKQFMYSNEYYNLKDMYTTLKKSKLFNESFYKTQNPDIPKDKDMIRHYVEFGYLESRNPSQHFDTDYYLTNYSDIKAAGINPVYHYIKSGYYEGRFTSAKNENIGIIRRVRIKRYQLKNSQMDLTFANVMRYVRKNGLKASFIKTKNILFNANNGNVVYVYNQPELTETIKNEVKSFKKQPKISVVMPVYNVDPKWLDLAIKSIENQWYENWEICLVDDCSTNKNTIKYLKNINSEKIKVKFLEKNLNISGATNEGLRMCTGEYIGLMDNDDEITVDALYEMVKKINEGFTFIYSDEDKLDLKGGFCEPHFKADFSRDMLNSQNYISHFTVTKKEYFDKVKGFTLGLEGSQDFDLYLKIFDMCKPKVSHIPKVLYHWRKIPGSTASEFTEKSYAQDAGMIALQNSLDRQGVLAKASNGGRPGTYRVDYDIIGEPLVSIIIPFKDGKSLLTTCVESILNISTYKNFEIIGISNNSTLEETFEEMERLKALDKRVKFFEYNVPFNYSDINNYAIREHSNGDYVVLLNNDIEILTENWVELMLGFAQRENTGAVGAKLYYPNDNIQHAGVIIGIGGVAGHSHKYFSREENGYFSRLNIIQNLSAVTAAFLMVSRAKFDEINGLNSNELKIAFNDVDFCLRLQEEGYVNVFTPYVEAYHYESISRGSEDSPEKVARFNSEVNYMLKRHKDIIENGDPYYNVNLTLVSENFGLK